MIDWDLQRVPESWRFTTFLFSALCIDNLLDLFACVARLTVSWGWRFMFLQFEATQLVACIISAKLANWMISLKRMGPPAEQRCQAPSGDKETSTVQWLASLLIPELLGLPTDWARSPNLEMTWPDALADVFANNFPFEHVPPSRLHLLCCSFSWFERVLEPIT